MRNVSFLDFKDSSYFIKLTFPFAVLLKFPEDSGCV